ncbi:DUF3732 domain-containing protein [Kitasatospora griseola]|uniref:DUF3732 domain-containing protein n=1 Tax=Kitasatospora griseola TaxID=2064 RepID=UPI003650010B
MTFQINAVTVYGKHPGQVRTVPFHTGALNIVTGDSRRGKSALLTIIDYCLASSDYPVKAGKVRTYVSTYAITLSAPGRQLFVARQAPAAKKNVSTVLCLLPQAPGSPAPPIEELAFSTPLEAAKDILSDFCGIDRTVQVPAVARAQTIAPSIRHALYFCVQAQNEIANPDLLFHSQGEEWRPNIIRGVVPYFLGAVDPEQAALRHRLQLLRRELSELEAKLTVSRALSPAAGQALALLAEAAEANLLVRGDGEPSFEDALHLLASVLSGELSAEPPSERDDDPLAQAMARRSELRRAHGATRMRIADLKRALEENSDFAGQAGEQRSRLASLGLLRVNRQAAQVAQCPVCESPVTSATATMAAITRDLEQLSGDLQVISSDTPALQSQLARHEEHLQALRSALARNQDEINEISAGLRALQQEPDQAQRAAHVRGRISLYLDTVAQQPRTERVEDNRDQLRQQIAGLEAQLSDDTQDDRLTSYLSLISQRIRDKAQSLALDHSKSPIRLDVNKLTIIADTPDEGPIRLPDMGSAENHLGYHIATLLTLHEWFSEHSGPVPRVLMLDQPSQVYFPPDHTGDPTLQGNDLTQLLDVYRVIDDTVRSLDGALQVIVVEHADLADPVFHDHVVDRWRHSNGQALVPEEWITEPDGDS